MAISINDRGRQKTTYSLDRKALIRAVGKYIEKRTKTNPCQKNGHGEKKITFMINGKPIFGGSISLEMIVESDKETRDHV